MIVFNCPGCGKRFQAPDNAAGKAASCPACKAPVTVPIAFEEHPPTLREVADPPAPPPRARAPEPARPSLSMPLLIGSGVALCALIGIAIGFLFSGHHAPEQASSATASVADAAATATAPAPAAVPLPVATPAPSVVAQAAPQPSGGTLGTQPTRLYQQPYGGATWSGPATGQGNPQQTPEQSDLEKQRNEVAAQIQDLREKQDIKSLKQQRDLLEKQIESPDAPAAQTGADAPFSQANPPKSTADVVAVVAPSVVTVSTDQGSVGTGWVAFEKTLIVTNYHVIRGGRTFTIQLFVGDGASRHKQQFKGVVKAVSFSHDLALLEVMPQTVSGTYQRLDLRPLSIAVSACRAGDNVIAIGNPGVGDQILEQTVTTGIVSNTERKLSNNSYIQTTAPINPGNSGGPLFNGFGEVIGVVTAKGVDVENIGFAVPVAAVKDLYDKRFSDNLVNNQDFTQWEHEHAVDNMVNLDGAIKVNSDVNDMMVLRQSNELVALATARNKVLVIDSVNGRVTSEIFPGTEPTQMLSAGRSTIWVMCHSSNTFALVDLKQGKVISSLHCANPPIAFAIARERIWYVDQQGVLYTLPLTGGQEARIDVHGVASIAFMPGSHAGDLLCGSSQQWLVLVKTESLLSIESRIKRVENDLIALQRAARTGDPDAIKQSMLRQQQLQDLQNQLVDCIKPISGPADGRRGYQTNYCLQALFLDPAHHRLYFNRFAMDLDHPENILGQFEDVKVSSRTNFKVNNFFNEYPYYRQILAVSPDGKYAASGTHLFNATDFTAVCELPVPSTSVVFAADSRSLYLADPFNQQIDPFPIPGLEPAKPAPGDDDKAKKPDVGPRSSTATPPASGSAPAPAEP